MPMYRRFEELPVWQEAARLYNAVLDLLSEPNLPVSGSFKNQLDRAALSVSNNIAEGFERVTTRELNSFLAIARGSAGEVRSMIAVVQSRPKLKPYLPRLQEIRVLSESCSRQITSWTSSNDESKIQGKRHLTPDVKKSKGMAQKVKNFRLHFLRTMPKEHPLYNTREARAARGEKIEDAE